MNNSNKSTILKILYICVLVCLLIGCNNIFPKIILHKECTILSFNWYTSKDSIVYPYVYEFKKYALDTLDSVVVYNEGKTYCDYKEKYVKDKGIYRVCNKVLTLTHSFIDTTNDIRFCLIKEPFLNDKVIFSDFKTYNINGKVYKLYQFSEFNGSHSGYNSYYLDGIGFICYYNFDRDDYILCDSTNIKSLDIKEITHKLVRDTLFFARYIGAKLMPHFYRQKFHYSKYPFR